VKYFFGGHDHLHNRAAVFSTDGTQWVYNMILASNSYKFYQPLDTANDVKYDIPAFGRERERQLSQDLYKIGYYIVTVDGSQVTVDYYAVPTGLTKEGTISTSPILTGNWKKIETYGYNLKERTYKVNPGSSFASYFDQFNGTRAGFLSGTSDSTAKDASNRSFFKGITTSWTVKTGYQAVRGMGSNIVRLAGISNSVHGDTCGIFAFAMTYDTVINESAAPDSAFGLVVRDENGKWINAVNKNFGGTPHFVLGAYASSYPIGTYGIDIKQHIVWAVLNYNNANFAVAKFASWADGWVWGN
jgi:hypothetical protein